MEDIIPFDHWINTQLSVARHYGSVKINDKLYIVDYIFAKDTPDGLCKPDLVEESLHFKMMKDNPEVVKAYYQQGKVEEQKQLGLKYNGYHLQPYENN